MRRVIAGSFTESTVSKMVRSPSWIHCPMEWRSVVKSTDAGKIPFPSLPSLSP